MNHTHYNMQSDHYRKVMNLHGMLPGRSVTIKSSKNTRDQGWFTRGQHDKLVGKTVIVKEVHPSVIAAVKIEYPDEDTGRLRSTHFHFEDLVMKKPKPIKNKKVFFDLSTLDYC